MAVDLEIKNLALSSTTFSSGDDVDIDWRVVNSGSTDAATTYSGFYLFSSDFSQSWLLGFQSAGTSGANTFDSENDTITIPNGLPPGDYYISVIADYDFRVVESNEFNNAQSVSVTIVAGVADLDIVNASLDDTTLAPGDSITANWEVENIGNGSIGTTNVAIRIKDLSTGNYVLSSNGTEIFAVEGTRSLNAGQTDTGENATFLLPSDLTAGNYQVELLALTPSGEDSNVLNNIETINFSIQTTTSPLDAIIGDDPVITSGTLKVYFGTGVETFVRDGITYTSGDFSEQQITALYSIFGSLEGFVDLDFEITTNRAEADISILSGELPGTLKGFYRAPEKIIVLDENDPRWGFDPDTGPEPGSLMFETALHEIGHWLGLEHTHGAKDGSTILDGVTSSSDFGDFELNQAIFSVMSYVDGWATAPYGVPSTFDYGFMSSFGALDIAALQQLYGISAQGVNTGDTEYSLDSSNGNGTAYSSIWDTGGNSDIISFSGSQNAVIDLRPATLQYEAGGGGYVSYVDGVHSGYTIANGVVIENASGGSGDDTITGNSANNKLYGNAGLDEISGLDGRDKVFGGADADTLSGGRAKDKLYGGGGNDLLFGNKGNDFLKGGAGKDKLIGGRGADVFDFNKPSDSRNNSQADIIKDFETGIDQIDLSDLIPGSFAFIGSSDFSGSNEEVQVMVNSKGKSIVRIDVDGDGNADMKIILNDVTGIDTGDFIL